ncbi:hypothetical protein [Acinetobacter bereziniae]|uniref:hypothetical protein n=1 Tax=Acinetobacter bereziniae TaxID=106648 RepID=UPI0012509B88|nr:hypothetical protein [Acinetobacter bereziniae]
MKQSRYLDELNILLNQSKFEQVEVYLKAHSNLPGPRANLELSYSFARYFANISISQSLWEFLEQLLNTSTDGNSRETILPFSALLGLSQSYFSQDTTHQKIILNQNQTMMNDSRWRLREAAAMACQIIGEQDFSTVKNWFEQIYPDSSLLEKRGILVALAHPPLLTTAANTVYCLNLCEQIFNDIFPSDHQTIDQSEAFKTLKKSLEYVLSVFVAADPLLGFDLLAKLAERKHQQINKILKANLSKSRLTKKYMLKINKIYEMMDQ